MLAVHPNIITDLFNGQRSTVNEKNNAVRRDVNANN